MLLNKKNIWIKQDRNNMVICTITNQLVELVNIINCKKYLFLLGCNLLFWKEFYKCLQETILYLNLSIPMYCILFYTNKMYIFKIFNQPLRASSGNIFFKLLFFFSFGSLVLIKVVIGSDSEEDSLINSFYRSRASL